MYGDPVGTRTYVNKGQVCGFDGCDRAAKQLGYCGTHASRVQRHGTTDDVRAFANAPEGMKWCPCCQAYKTVDEFFIHRSKPDGRSIECKPCGRARVKSWRERNPEKVAAMSRRRSETGAGAASTRRYRKTRPHIGRDNAAGRRVRLRGVERESFTKQQIFDRDKWTCQLCGKRISRRHVWPHPFSPTIDHIIPLADKGPHTRANVQAAHARCNISKKRSARNEQLRLIG